MRATNDEIAVLGQFDTPTICNGLEILDPGARDAGYTRTPMVLAPPHLEMQQNARAVCGRAKTMKIRSAEGHGRTAQEHAAKRMESYEYVAGADGPIVMVVEDTDPQPLGAYWGEVQSAVHQALGCIGVVTNGTVRDLDDLDAGLMILAGAVSPSHAHVHWTHIGEGATVFGMTVRDGDVVHADAHGAVVVPEHAVAELPRAIAEIQEREERILCLTRSDEPLDMAALRTALGL